jgi:superfamily II DNA or RNA helicase
MQGATGSGKSIISTSLVKRALKKNSTVMFIVPRKDLIRQMAGTFYKFGIDYSYIASGMRYDFNTPAHIASKDTLIRRMNDVRPPKLAIIDETHYGGAGLGKIVDWLKSHGSYIIGLSATPWLLSGKGLGCWYDEMVCGPSVKWLIDNGRLSDYRAFAPTTVDLSGIRTVAGDYNRGDLSERMEQDKVLVGDAVKHYKKYADGKLGVTFAVSRKHSEILAEAYNQAGVPAAHVDGETSMEDRSRIFKDFADGKILQLCNAELLTFGFDISMASGVKDVAVECITDCAPTKSLAKQMQKWGRGLRHDNDAHMFFDHANNIATHGLPCSEREWSLADWKTKRGGHKEERSIPVRMCEKCYACFKPAPICPNCGHKFKTKFRTIEEIEGELEEISREKAEAEKKEKKNKLMEVGRAKTMDDLWAIARERNYKPGWVYKRARLKGIRT